jgi:PAS domain S-box-containing protein
MLAVGAWLTAGRAAPATEKVVLQLPYTHQFQFAGLYAAVQQGFFRAEGLEVELRVGTKGLRPVDEVVAGRAQFGIGQTEILIERLKGRPLVAVGAIFQHSPFALLVREDSGISTPTDLIGKRIAMSGERQNIDLQAMLLVEGLKRGQFVIVPDKWNHNEVATGEADATTIYLPDARSLADELGLKYKLIRPADYGVDFYGDCLFTSERELAEHPARMEPMRRAVRRGWEYALAHREELIDWILRDSPAAERTGGLTRSALEFEAVETARLISADLVEVGHMNPGRWQRMAELIVATGGADSTRHLEGFVYTELVERTPGWVRWLIGGLVLVAAVALLALLANWRLQSLVRRRTQELEISEQRQRDYFELAPAPIVIEDYTGVDQALAALRAEGVTDLRAHLADRKELVWDLHRLKRVVAANRLALVRTGFNTVDEMSRNLGDVMTDQAMQMFVEELVTLWRGEDRLTVEKTYQSKQGEKIHTLINWEVGRRDGQRDLANVRLVFTEITQQKAAELALRQSEERYRQLFEQAVGGIYRSSPDAHFISVNPGFARMLGFDRPEEMIAWTENHPMQTLYLKPGRREEFVAAINERGELHDFESEVRSRGEGTRWISENARAVRDEAGRLLYYEGFVTDISARRQLESEMARASKLEAVGILAGGIAHDFNNILTVVLGNITLIEADVTAGGELAARLHDAKRATLRARDLTLQLLTFAKGGEPVKANIELPELLKESAGFALHGAKARGEFRVARDLWRVHADKGQLGQVVQNLVINAVQAMPDGGVVTVTAENFDLVAGTADAPPLAPGRYVHLAVADSGTGIAPEHVAKIFDPYFTTKEQGSGLGLATAYSIIRKHAGHIQAESTLGRGTTFHLWLPVAADAPRPVIASASGSRSPFRARVLFMDDEPSIRTMAGIFMQRIGYDCDVAADGAEAVRKYEAALSGGRRYEAVVMDLTVPGGMGGREAMERLRQLDPSVCAIVSSGYSRDPVLANYRLHGFQAILPKPYGLEQLTQVLATVMDGAANPT